MMAIAVRAFAAAPDGVLDPRAVLEMLERAADWQLQHPCSFELRWRQSGGLPDGHLRVGWDGTIMRRFTLDPLPVTAAAVTPEWGSMIGLAEGKLGFADLPAGVRRAWQVETGLKPEAILSVELLDNGATRSWEMATLYHGLSALAEISRRASYRLALRQAAEANEWRLGRRVYHADDHAVGLLYLEFSRREDDPVLRADVEARLDWIMKHPARQPIDIRAGQDRWTWSDALFMAPPVWARLSTLTGNRAYLEFMDREWWGTTDALLSDEDRLYYRDSTYLDRRESNGERVYWSRGNGWVLASLAMLLEEMPRDFSPRSRYERLFQSLAARVSGLQPADGLWRSSLLDPESNPNPESSSSALFCFAIAKGVRLGLLPAEEYLPVVTKTWKALRACVRADGQLGRVQQPGAGPGTAEVHCTAPYGVGAFLLAGVEVYRLAAAEADMVPTSRATAVATN